MVVLGVGFTSPVVDVLASLHTAKQGETPMLACTAASATTSTCVGVVLLW